MMKDANPEPCMSMIACVAWKNSIPGSREMTKTGKMDKDRCSSCGFISPDKNLQKCSRCGVALGNPFERAIDEMQKYDEGCEPRTYKEYDEEG
ncbi:hypothetical protein HY488_03480 [Candidatus Woesearchaeota archaeon]|nr:hypothetical protein [Candidatus Woesearchaeota archaeon]